MANPGGALAPPGLGPPKAPANKPAAAKGPKVRMTAAAQHLGAPRAAPQRAPRAPQRAPRAAPRPPKVGSGQKPLGTLNPGDIHNVAVTQGRLAQRAELAPLQSQAQEIRGNEQGASQAYGKLVSASEPVFQGIIQNMGASAKTAENTAAEAALQAPKAVETAGQSQASMTAGYASPELRSELLNEAQQAGANAGSRSLAAQNIAQGGQNLIEEMRGAAALKALGGGQNITNTFQKQLVTNENAQRNAITKSAGRVPEIEQKLGQQNFADALTKAKLANEGIKIGQAGAKIRQTGELGAAKVRATERGQNLATARNRENVGQRERANLRTTSTAERDTILRIQAQVNKSSKGRTTAGGKPPTADALNKLSAELGAAYQGFVEGRGGKEKLSPAEIRQNLTIGKEGKKGFPKAVNQAIITAAQELYYTHRVSKTTRDELGKLGMNIGYDNEAFHAVSGK